MIAFQTDHSVKDAFGPKGKFPWITINGQHFGDTQLIMETLNKYKEFAIVFVFCIFVFVK